MPDLLEQLRTLLLTLVSPVHAQHPARFAVFPCAVLYESGNTVHARCDGHAHLHEIEYTLEFWALSPAETHALSARVDDLFSSLGLSRMYCTDLFDDATSAHRRVLRYRALCDTTGVLTQ